MQPLASVGPLLPVKLPVLGGGGGGSTTTTALDPQEVAYSAEITSVSLASGSGEKPVLTQENIPYIGGELQITTSVYSEPVFRPGQQFPIIVRSVHANGDGITEKGMLQIQITVDTLATQLQGQDPPQTPIRIQFANNKTMATATLIKEELTRRFQESGAICPTVEITPVPFLNSFDFQGLTEKDIMGVYMKILENGALAEGSILTGTYDRDEFIKAISYNDTGYILENETIIKILLGDITTLGLGDFIQRTRENVQASNAHLVVTSRSNMASYYSHSRDWSLISLRISQEPYFPNDFLSK
jgi:hypothetical protein